MNCSKIHRFAGTNLIGFTSEDKLQTHIYDLSRICHTVIGMTTANATSCVMTVYTLTELHESRGFSYKCSDAKELESIISMLVVQPVKS